ncbi:substrate-binding domain-containing protein [Kineococcus arenarius]|uniref:substrate-binding domain-containing protein n=1 Tax=unclassified Kineococcus TaxID=2621656 RepID=UPI003D7EABEB
MIPLFGDSEAGGKRDVLEGRLLWTALRAAERGLNVVVDFGLWRRDERSALRWLFAVGADCRTEYLTSDPETRLARVRRRFTHAPGQTFAISAEDLWQTIAILERPSYGRAVSEDEAHAPQDGAAAGSSSRAVPGVSRSPRSAQPVPGKPPTIHDVAAAAGVAASTVSRAFSRPGRVKSETADRIRAVAEQLGYRTNPIARALPTGRTGLLGLVVSDVSNPFFSRIVRGAQEIADREGYTLLLTDIHGSATAERTALERTLPLVEGVILGTSRMSDSTIRLMAKQRPTVVLNRILTGIPSVVPNSRIGVRQALEHLAELGHRSVTYAAGPVAAWVDGMRWRAFQESAEALGLHPNRTAPLEPTIEGGREAADDLLRRHATAVIAYNDLVALGIGHALRSRGVRVPQQVSVLGFDNSLAPYLPLLPLTTIDAPSWDMGRYGAEVLLRGIRSGTFPEARRPTWLPTRLIVRSSTGPAPRRR